MRFIRSPHRLLLLAFCCSFCVAVAAQTKDAASAVAPQPQQLTTAQWREDLRFMAEEMPKRHKNLFHTVSRERFESAVKKLDERIPLLARHQIIVEMARIVGMVGDGHTNIAPTRDPKIGFRSLPIKLYLFKDGLFIRAAERGHAELLGARVIKIGDATPDEAVSRAREIIGRDNEMDVKFFAPFLLAMPEVLHALGLSNSTESARFIVEKSGKQQTLTLKPIGPAELLPAETDLSWLPKQGWVDMRDKASAPAPLWLKEPRNKFWFEYLTESKTVYAQINEVGNKDTESLADFSKRLFSFVEANPVDKLVLDLRLNRGGSGTLLRPLEIGLIKSKIDQPGRLFVIMGRSTWSASQFLLNRMEKYTNVLFVGEPSGSKGNAFGDSRKITLPNGGITVRVSVYYWQDWSPWDTRLWTAPHLTAELSSEDYRNNTDVALEAILNYKARKPLAQLLEEALIEGGIDSAVKTFREFKADPFNKYAATEEPLLNTGERLLNQKKPPEALVLFKLDAEDNPHSYRAYYAMGVAYFRMGNKEQAVKNLERASEMNPKNYDVAQWLRQTKQ